MSALWVSLGVAVVWTVTFALMAREEIADWWLCLLVRAGLRETR